jgi:hypothetical protein
MEAKIDGLVTLLKIHAATIIEQRATGIRARSRFNQNS